MASKTNYLVIDYVRTLTKGLINLREEHVEHIRGILEKGEKENQVLVKLSKFDSQAKLYKNFRQFYVSESLAREKIEKVKNAARFTGFYKLEITELSFSIETVNERLFES